MLSIITSETSKLKVCNAELTRPLTDAECDRLCAINFGINTQWPHADNKTETPEVDIGLLEQGLIDEFWSDDGQIRNFQLTPEGVNLRRAMNMSAA